MSLLLWISVLALNIQPVNAEPSYVTITAQYSDSCPTVGADVWMVGVSFFGVTAMILTNIIMERKLIFPRDVEANLLKYRKKRDLHD